MKRLLIRPGALGDFIVSLAALEFLKTEYTEVWTTEANVPLARFADDALSIVSVGLDALELKPGVLNRLSSFDSVISWYGANRNDFRAQVRHLPFQFHRALPVDSDGIHATDYYLRQVGGSIGATPSLPVQRKAGDYIAIHPFSGSRKKNWPLESFEAVASHLGSVEWLAGPEEELPAARRFDDLWNLAQWIAGARLYIGNDSGITHLAAACGVPVIAIFGPTNPDVWAPRGDVQVLRSPSVDEVIAASMRRLRESNLPAAGQTYPQQSNPPASPRDAER